MSEALKCKVRRKNLVDDDQLQKLIDSDCKLLTSKQFAQLVNLKTDAALRKQRSKNRSLFPYCRIGRRIFYPMDLIMQTLHKNVVSNELR
jgi:predicted metal-dependent hydrolase|tara:strand:- start:158 stop:427 length:270 start_codon:yes stop_codon:yes gene_type:complete